MTAPIAYFIGDTFDEVAIYYGDDGQPASLVGVVVTAWLQTRDAQVPVTTLVTNANAGVFALHIEEAVTATVPAGIWPLFVRYVASGDTRTEQAARVAWKDAA